MKRFLLVFVCVILAASLYARIIPVTFDTATSTFYTNGVVWVPGTGSGGASGTNTWLATMAPLALNTAQTNTYTNGIIVEATVGLQTLLSTDVAKVVAMVETNSGSGAFVIKDIAMFGGIAASNQNTLVYTVPPNCRHYLTNLSAGTSIASVITNWIDQLITAGPTGATGATGAAGPSMSTNANQFLGVPLSISSGVLITNPAFYGSLFTNFSDINYYPNNTTISSLGSSFTIAAHTLFTSGGGSWLLVASPNTNTSATTYFTGISGSGDLSALDVNGKLVRTNLAILNSGNAQIVNVVVTNNVVFTPGAASVDSTTTNVTVLSINGPNVLWVNARSNVNITAIMEGASTVVARGTLILTNRTGTDRILGLSAVSNNWTCLQQFDGITAPHTLTNGLAARLDYEIIGTNVQYSFKPVALPK